MYFKYKGLIPPQYLKRLRKLTSNNFAKTRVPIPSTVKSCSVNNTFDQNRNIVLTASSGIIEPPVRQDWKWFEKRFHGCTWNIQLPTSRSIINFTFTHLAETLFYSRCVHASTGSCRSQPGSCSCESHDYMDIYDGFANTGIFLGRYCREAHPPQTIYTTGGRIAIVFHHVFLDHKKRFSANFSSLTKNGKYYC